MNKKQLNVYFKSLQEIEITAGDMHKLLNVLLAYCESNPDCEELESIIPILDLLFEKSLNIKNGLVKFGDSFLNCNMQQQ